MKKTILMAASLLAAALMVSCGAKPEKTIENLKTAITGEANASAKYAAFAVKAQEEGYNNIARMLEATSAAEKIHENNHQAELAKLGVKDFVPVVDEVKIDSTLANLYLAKEGEDYEFTTMYPEFIKVAEQEKAKGALVSFDWANRTESKHSAYYQAAIDALQNNGNDQAFAGEWVVCPKCGDTYVASELGAACDFCGTTSDNFVKF